MLELSSFGGEGSGGAYRRGRKADTAATATDSATADRSRGSFPLASFAPPSSNSSASGQSSNRASDRQGSAGGAADDDAGEQLQKELELFAQDDDAEERALMDSAPQEDWADHEQWATNDERTGGNAQAEGAGDDLDELEKYFDQKQY